MADPFPEVESVDAVVAFPADPRSWLVAVELLAEVGQLWSVPSRYPVNPTATERRMIVRISPPTMELVHPMGPYHEESDKRPVSSPRRRP
jgi:hypothetical protein